MLKPKITLFNGVAIAISMVVGSGLFGLPGLAIQTLMQGFGWLIIYPLGLMVLGVGLERRGIGGK